VILLLTASIVASVPTHGPPPGLPKGPPPWAHGPPGHSTGASVQARATIRVISGARLHLGKLESSDPFVVRDAIVRSTGVPEPLKLFEFQ